MRVSVIPYPEGGEYAEAERLVDRINEQDQSQKATLNGIKAVDSRGQVWFGIDYGGLSFWITSILGPRGFVTAIFIVECEQSHIPEISED